MKEAIILEIGEVELRPNGEKTAYADVLIRTQLWPIKYEVWRVEFVDKLKDNK